MLPLASSSLPVSAPALAESLAAGLAAHGVTVARVEAAGDWPRLQALDLDLTGAPLEAVQQLPRPASDRLGEFSAARLTLIASPARLRTAAIQVHLQAVEASFAFAPAEGRAVALLVDAAQGQIRVEVARPALEALIFELAAAAAGEHGVEIKSTRLQVEAHSPRSVSLVAEVTAKAFIATATIKISGDLAIDDQLVARLSNLRFMGDGMIANLAGGVIRPQLTKLEGARFPLLSLALGGISLREVRIEAGESLCLMADFGRA